MKKFILATLVLFSGVVLAQNTGNWETDYGPSQAPVDTSTVLFQNTGPLTQHVGTWKQFKDDIDYSADGSGVLPVANGGTGAGTLSNLIGPAELQSTTVTPGSYTLSNLTVDADGRITSISNGAGGGSGDLLAGEYGGVSVESNATTTTFGGSSTDFSNKVQITVFDTDGTSSDNTTPANGTDDITIGVAGPYIISANVSFSGANSETYSFAIFIDNGATQIGPRFTRKLGTGGDVGSATISVIANLTATDTVELWCQNEGGTGALTVQDANLGVASVPGFDPALVETTTWGDGSEASFVWTASLSGANDPSLTWADGDITASDDFSVDGDLAVVGSSTFGTLDVTTLNTDVLNILDSVDQSHGLSITAESDLTAARELQLTTGDATVAMNLTDPGADEILVWDDTAGTYEPASLPAGWSYDGDNLVAGAFIEKHAASHTLSAAECYGSVYYVTAAATLTLPAAADGMSLTVISNAQATVTVDANAADLIILDGTALDDGDSIDSPGAAGDLVTLTYYDATGWFAVSNTWTDGGP